MRLLVARRKLCALVACCWIIEATKVSEEITSSDGPGVLLAAPAAQSDRRLTQWKFIQFNASVHDSTKDWQDVIVPHSWNVRDGQDGGDNYYRGPGWYQHQLEIENHQPGTRYFVRFQAVGTVAEVFLDKLKIVEHKGGYTAFATEITPYVREGSHDLRVKADNSYREDVAPLSGDFTIAGGMHRPVDLIVKRSLCISPVDDASPGVLFFQENVTEVAATLRIQVLLDNGLESHQPTRTVISLMNAERQTVASNILTSIIPGGTVKPLASTLSISRPHLWHGISDPYMYSLRVEVYCGQIICDVYTKRVGFRSIQIDPKDGLYLNGKHYPLRGVNMHYDHQDMGAALTDEQIYKDFELVKELGANSVRLAHYPHSALSHERCDELGLLVWAEIPVVNEIKDTRDFIANSRQQLVEMIKQLGNHCSIYNWGLSNELFQRETDDPFQFLEELNELSNRTDATRYTILATNTKRKELNTITTLFGANLYPGWYGSNPYRMKRDIMAYDKIGDYIGVSVSEYGAGGSILHHDQSLTRVEPKGKWHPEEWQAFLHEIQYRGIVDYRPCWGSYIWLMFDFSSDGRNEGDRPGVNDKGLMTHDHLTKKDAFHFYQANWRDVPVLHLTSKRHLNRTEKMTPVKVYSNSPQVELILNGFSMGMRQPNDLNVALWDFVELEEGNNTILVRSPDNGLVDRIEWTYDPNATAPAQAKGNFVIEGFSKASDAVDDRFGPSRAFDNNPKTRWSSRAKSPWVSKELGDDQVIRGLKILWYKSDIRSYKFQLETSMDGNTWKAVYSGNSRKRYSAETYLFRQPEHARHIRIICHGSTTDLSNLCSIREVMIRR